MKKLLFTCVFLLSALCLSAQSVSYANMMRLAKQTSISGFGQVARSLGYKLIHTQTKDERSTIVYGWGSCYWDEDRDDLITYDNKPWACVSVAIKDDGSGGWISWYFSSLKIYNALKNQVKTNGWKFHEDEVNNTGVTSNYYKSNTDNFISLEEDNTGSYGFTYFFYPD